MPITYDYRCGNCGYNFQIRQSIKENPLIDCPECRENTLKRIFHAVDVLPRGEPVTLAQQADRNTSKMGHYELEEKRQAQKEGARPKPKIERPWWRKSDKINMELAKLAPNVTIEKGKITKSEPLSKKAEDYIMKGKKP